MPHMFLRRKKEMKQICERIFNHIYSPVAELDTVAWLSKEPLTFDKKTTGTKKEMKPGIKWGDLFDCAWFRFTGKVPAAAKGEKVVLLIDLHGEGCVFDEKGVPIRGLTSYGERMSNVWMGKRVVQFADKAKGGEKVDIWVDAGCNDLFGHYIDNGTLKECSIATCNEEMRQLYYDFFVLQDLMHNIPDDSARHDQILYALHLAANELRDFTAEEAKAARKILKPELDKKNGDPSLTVSAVGHAHIDLMWLWPERETRRKGARTFATVMEMMDRYPEFIFGQSQPQLYVWIKEDYPELYKKIKKRVKEGRWEAQGCMWVEADTNVSGGEALLRQCFYGKRFFRDEFGISPKYLWLPDVFGYSAALPQILKKCGVDYFMTQKLSWSLINKFPHQTFYWKGIDGSSVLAHMLPGEDYNSPGGPAAVRKAERNYLDKAVSDRCLMLFGVGDGGGGPGADHLERLRREKNLAGMAPVEIEKSEDFFKRIDIPNNAYDSWTGELYLERHRGTYTTEGRNKWFNRKMELALRELEMQAAFAGLVRKSAYPQKEIEAIWKEVLLFQFHDILPGSSIKRVYDETLERYAKRMEETKGLLDDVQGVMAGSIDTSAADKPAIAFNSLSWERTEWIKEGNKWRRVTTPSVGYTVVDLAEATPGIPELTATPEKIENDCVRVQFNKTGHIRSIYDKQQKREMTARGEACNRIVLYDDEGDAWDIPENYRSKSPVEMPLVESKATIDGPRAIVRQKRAIGKSTLTQEIIITAGSSRIDFITEVDWQERGKMMRSVFPVDVLAEEASCEIQFGNIKRPTHRNTSWDMAKYEICVQKWIDLSERSHGVALLNDSKYGHSVEGNTLEIDLLRSPSHPDVEADLARHSFTYAIFPHAGDYAVGGVVREGYALNAPISLIPAQSARGKWEAEKSFVSLSADSHDGSCPVVVETIKKADDSDDIIVRLYEAHGGSANVVIDFGMDLAAAQVVDMMEENGKDISVRNNRLRYSFGAFEIVTLKLTPA